jgi:hypothetical protein
MKGHETMFTKGSKPGQVLQGYFRLEQLRGGGRGGPGRFQAKGRNPWAPNASRPDLPHTTRTGEVTQAKGRNFWAGKAPRPDLMATRTSGEVSQTRAVQAKERNFWAGKAPRPDLMAARTPDMPAAVRGATVLAKGAWGSAGSPGAPRPELLPGMRKPKVEILGAAAQARAATGVVTSPVPDGRLRLIGNGQPLEGGIRARMEGFFGADFSGVRVHEGPAAASLGALAFTLGETLYFAPGLYDPTTREGVELLGHELAHVVQQRDGRVSNPYGRGVAIVQDPGLEAEADAMGRRVAEEIWSGVGSRFGQAVLGGVVEDGRAGFVATNRLRLSSGLQLAEDLGSRARCTHGTAIPCYCRVGFEGITILNDSNVFSDMYTDGLVNCVQLIIRSTRATFMCHIITSKATGCLEYFRNLYLTAATESTTREFPLQDIYLFHGTTADPSFVAALCKVFYGGAATFHGPRESSGKMINLRSGVVMNSPHVQRAYLGGFSSHPDAVAHRHSDPLVYGSEGPGDAMYGCPGELCKVWGG